MNTGDRVQAKANGHRGTLTELVKGFSFTVRYDGERHPHTKRKVRGPKVTYPWVRLGAFNVSKVNPGVQDG